MAANGISTLATKELRQVAKLDLAANNRSASSNPRASYVITQLPTQYDDNAVVDNPNVGAFTLTPGVITAGVKKVTYTGYHEDNVAFTDTATVTASTTATNFNIASIAENTTVLYTGYLLGTYTGDWTFTQTGDDGAYLWIGANAVSGYTTGNANAVSTYNTTGTVTVAITAGVYYPIRLLYGNSPAGGFLNLTYSHTGQSATNDFTGKLFSPGVQLVVGRPWIAGNPAPVTQDLILFFDSERTDCYPGTGTTIYNLVDNTPSTLGGNCTFSDGVLRLNNNTGNMGTNTARINCQTVSDFRTISLWYRQVSDSGGDTRYILDARESVVGGYVYTGDPYGPAWAGSTMYEDGGVGVQVNYTEQIGTWRNLTIVNTAPMTDDINLFSRYTNDEGLDVEFGACMIYSRAITYEENLQNFNQFKTRYGL
jgi:hypothetical protein